MKRGWIVDSENWEHLRIKMKVINSIEGAENLIYANKRFLSVRVIAVWSWRRTKIIFVRNKIQILFYHHHRFHFVPFISFVESFKLYLNELNLNSNHSRSSWTKFTRNSVWCNFNDAIQEECFYIQLYSRCKLLSSILFNKKKK